ncbi:ankyrin repeat family protein [Favolaschia claudopus]|uniref:Ankyrin repeat family protein n=1 Tax=Favolaschia claudopus TaxID=2862362 RepID=A0AAW0DXL2_9AGAR
MEPQNTSRALLGCLGLQIDVENHWEYPRVIKTISVQVEHAQLGNIGSMEAWRISRGAHCGDRFLEIMDEDMDEMHQFSVALFDKCGHVRPELVDAGYRSGTGCWGREMDSGALIYILGITINESHRGQAVGTWALAKFLESEHVQAEDTVICWPTPVGIRDKEIWKVTRTRQIAFFRKNHFRRIGRTGFFGFSSRLDHPSRNIPMADDADALDNSFSNTASSPEEQRIQFPLHSAIVNDKTVNIMSVIQSFYDQDPASIHKPDNMGATPILVAAGSQNLNAIRKLLEWDISADLENAANSEGVTPLERLADSMRSGREFAEIFLGWNGYSNDELTMQYLLKQGLVQNIDATLPDYIAKSKYGCTCNQCAGGWLSPRMRFRLDTNAVFWADSMPMNFDMFTKGRPQNPLDMMDSPSSYIPPALYPNFYLSFYKGYCDILRAIYDFLNTTTAEPLSANAVVPFIAANQYTQFFFAKGGRIEYAFDSITDCAREQSPLGDNSFSETFDDDEDWMSLPTCANDLEFQLVRRMIGLDDTPGSGQRWGRYYEDSNDEGMDFEEDSDDDDEGMEEDAD